PDPEAQAQGREPTLRAADRGAVPGDPGSVTRSPRGAQLLEKKMDDYVAVRMCGTADRVLPWLSGEKTVKAILLLGDDPDTCSTLQDLLRAERYHVVVASGWAVAARCMEKI